MKVVGRRVGSTEVWATLEDPKYQYRIIII